MANIKPIDQSADKWVRRASVAGPDYLAGVQNPRSGWADGAIAAEGNYKTGVSAAAAAGKYGKGVRRVGEAGWKVGATQKGPSRFAEGVALAKDNWSAGFSPMQAALAALKLPPRGPKGSPQNLQRVAAVASTLRAVAEKGGV